MLYYDRIDVSEGIYVNKTTESKECNFCHYYCFLNKGLKFQPHVCNGCHDLLMMFMNLSDIAILNIKSANYCCIISGISKSEAINLMQDMGLNEKKQNIVKQKNLLSYIKKGKEILTFGDIEIEKNKFYHYKSPIFLKDVDIEKALVSNKIFSAEKNYKYFIGYMYDEYKVKPLHIMLPKMSAYVKSCNEQTIVYRNTWLGN